MIEVKRWLWILKTNTSTHSPTLTDVSYLIYFQCNSCTISPIYAYWLLASGDMCWKGCCTSLPFKPLWQCCTRRCPQCIFNYVLLSLPESTFTLTRGPDVHWDKCRLLALSNADYHLRRWWELHLYVFVCKEFVHHIIIIVIAANANFGTDICSQPAHLDILPRRFNAHARTLQPPTSCPTSSHATHRLSLAKQWSVNMHQLVTGMKATFAI